MNNYTSLIEKYHYPAPRYTSYPTVPFWDSLAPSSQQWKQLVYESFNKSNDSEGISLYIHLPFCESLCTYCGCNTRITKNHAVEKPYLEAVLKEWQMYLDAFGKKPIIKELHLGGGTPTFFNAQNLEFLIYGILRQSHIAQEAVFSFEAHPNNTQTDHLQTLFHLGFKRLSLGIQDFDPLVQDVINRVQSFEQVKTITQKAREIGYTSINYDLIYGLPMQTLSGVKATIEKVIQLKPDRIAYYSYAHVPWIKPGQRKFTEADLPQGAAKRSLYELGRTLFLQNNYIETGMDHFALPGDELCLAANNGSMHRNFMGYTSSHTSLLVGLGVSSIGDTWTAFAQNPKKVEDYYQALQSGEFPIVKGHVLNNEDLIMRRHILNIMCRHETSWQQTAMQCPDMEMVIARLKELQNDGLIELNPFHVKVTEQGMPFLRIVCMAFDARLWRTQTKEQLFSSSI